MHSINTRIDTSVDFDVDNSRELSKEKFSVDVSAIESASKMNQGAANRSKYEQENAIKEMSHFGGSVAS